MSFIELVKEERLRAVENACSGSVYALEEKAIRAGRNGRPGQSGDLVPDSCPCDGIRHDGRCESFLITGSRRYRVCARCVSNVVCHARTESNCGLPPAMMYSALNRSSSIVAEHAAFESTGLARFQRRREIVLHVRAADLQRSTYGSIIWICDASHHFAAMSKPFLVRGGRIILSAFSPCPWKL